MGSKDVADGIRRYRAENTATTIMFWESFLLAAFIGFRYNSIVYFILAMIGIHFLSGFRVLAIILSIGFSLGWAVVGLVIGIGFFSSTLLGIALCIAFFFFAIRVHFVGYRVS